MLIEAEGLIHAINPALTDYTLCGDAFDLASDEPGYEWKETKKKTVTCPICCSIIDGVRNIRISHVRR